MRILITGSSGMLGRALCRKLADRHEVIGLDLAGVKDAQSRIQKLIECDLTDQQKTITEIVSARPAVVIHAAAYTDVDGSQRNPEKAHKINAQGTETIALASEQSQALLCYISTDFVFDGQKKSAYREEDRPNPINIYGQSKLEGERYVQSIPKRFAIVRSSWLFGQGGRNFVDSILEKAQQQSQIKVVNDQFGCPTYTKDLASGIARLIGLAAKLSGIYHLTNSGFCSWYEFACAIKEVAKLNVDIAPVSSQQYPSPTKRPKMSVLENRRYRKCTGQTLRTWQEALKEYLLK